MAKTSATHSLISLTRREVIAGALKTIVVSSVLPSLSAETLTQGFPWHAINIMNFIRAEEPRQITDLIQPVREQMALIKAHKFSATWLLQYDALAEGPFVEFLKAQMPPDHETGI